MNYYKNCFSWGEIFRMYHMPAHHPPLEVDKLKSKYLLNIPQSEMDKIFVPRQMGVISVDEINIGDLFNVATNFTYLSLIEVKEVVWKKNVTGKYDFKQPVFYIDQNTGKTKSKYEEVLKGKDYCYFFLNIKSHSRVLGESYDLVNPSRNVILPELAAA